MNQFSIRVYGVMINEHKQVLVSDELIRGNYYTKFPGGGLEFGEGTRDCMIREWKEELHQDIAIIEHLYTTDFFQISAFDKRFQIISVYYLVKPLTPAPVRFKDRPFDFDEPKEGAEAFRWVNWQDFSESSVTLPIDKVVARLVKEKFQ